MVLILNVAGIVHQLITIRGLVIRREVRIYFEKLGCIMIVEIIPVRGAMPIIVGKFPSDVCLEWIMVIS